MPRMNNHAQMLNKNRGREIKSPRSEYVVVGKNK